MQSIIKVKVKTRAKKEGVIEIKNGEFEIRVNVPPNEGKANKRVIELLSRYLKVPKTKLLLSKGHKSTNKIFMIDPE